MEPIVEVGADHDEPDEAEEVSDPVCGMKVDPTTATSVTHEGREIFFCSTQCRDTFAADPAAYLGLTTTGS